MVKQIAFVDMLQILFIAFKLAGIITWSWWLVLSPMIVATVLVIVTAAAGGANDRRG